MDKRYNSVAQVLAALKAYQRYEKVVLGFYFVNVLVFMFLAIHMSINLHQLDNHKITWGLPDDLFQALKIFWMIRFCVDVFWLLYFIKMARSFYIILSLNIKEWKFYGPMIFLAL